jgi:hypothetical protein
LKNKPSRITAHQVSKVYGIAKIGNKVFNDQIVKNGPKITNTAIRITIAKTPNVFIV